MHNQEAVRAAIAEELDACALKIRALLADAAELSEKEVLAAAERIDEMRRESEDNVRALDELARHFGSRGNETSGALEGAMRAQASTVNAFAIRLNQGIVDQRESTAGIMDVSKKIGAFVATIERLSQELRMLTLNARLEAARWGQQGAAFSTVASSMNDLTGQVVRANEQIGSLATNLAAITKRIVESESKMSSLGTELAESAETQRQSLLDAAAEASRVTGCAVESGVKRARRILTLSNDVLTNLQFQDRMAQVFKEVDSVVECGKKIADDFLESVPPEAGDDEVRAAMDAARDRAGSSAVRMSGESELSSSDRTMQPGVVEMF